MALILIRGETNQKLLNAIADIERHAKLNLSTRPKIVDPDFADEIVGKILNQKIRNKSKVATAFFVKEDITLSIIQVKKIHPPAHVVVVIEDYSGYGDLVKQLDKSAPLKGYYSAKNKGTTMKDYKYKSAREYKNSKIGYL
jgi:hypothetical protein